MELKNKIDWQVKNLQECGLSIQATGRNEFHVVNADTTNFAYYWTKKEPKNFENTSKTGKKYFVLAWKFDNVSKWVSIPSFKKIIVEDWYLITLERKFTNPDFIKELDQAAAGYDDVEPFVMKDDIYIKSAAKHNRDITKLNDAIAKNNTDLIEEEKEKIITENKARRAVAKKEHIEKMQRLQENISQIRKEELIKKISDLQNNLAIEPLNSEEIVNHLETEDNLTITEIETYIDRIIDQHFEKRFLTDTLLIYLIKGISLIAKTQTLTLNERNLKVDKYLLDKYNETISDLNRFVGDDDMDDEFCTDEVIIKELKKCFHIGKKVNLNKVLLMLDQNGINNTDLWNVTAIIQNNELEDDTVYNDEDQLVTAIEFIYKNNLNSKFADDEMDEEDIEIAANEDKQKELDEKFAPKQGSDCSDKAVITLMKQVYYLDKKVNLKKVIKTLNESGLTNQDILQVLNLVDNTECNGDDTVYKDEDQLVTAITFVYTTNFLE